MSEQLERGAEILKLARLLNLEPKDLGYLEQLPAGALRTFREQVTDRLFSGDGDRLRRVAAASKMVPVPLTVKVAQLAFGPLLCAAVAGLLDPRHAVKVATRCPTSFLADITVFLDPRRAPDVIAAVPTPLVIEVTKELLARQEHVTMGRFVNYLREETLRAAVPAIPDDADLLKVAFVMEGKEALDEVAELARDRFAGLIRTAYEQQLWAEALDLVGHLSLQRRAELGNVAAAQDEQLLNALVHAAHEMAAWDVLLPITAAMSEQSLRRFAQVPAVCEPDVLADIIETALSKALWRDLLPLTRYLPDEARTRVAEYVAAKDDATVERLAAEAHEAAMWEAMLPIALAFTPETQRRLAELPLLQRADVLQAVVDTAARHDLWDALLPLADSLPDDARQRIRDRAAAAGRALQE
jgi:hypothetical protein